MEYREQVAVVDFASSHLGALKTIVTGGAAVPGGPGYEDAIRRWSGLAVKQAGIVVFPKTAGEVSRAIIYANEHSIPFTVCCGGHATSGSSSIGPDGMLIHLRLMQAITVDADARTVTFGGGCLWRQVDAATAEHGLATPGGTVSHTGVGGLILGGGFGWLSGRYGLCIDNLLEVEVVLGNGRIVTANAASEPDLFWAMRGAGDSFGVTTRFTSRLYPQGDVWGGLLEFPHERLPEIIVATNEMLKKGDEDQCLMVTSTYATSKDPEGAERAKVATVCCFYNGTAGRAEGEVFKPLLSLGPHTNTAKQLPYPEMNQVLDDFLTYGSMMRQGGTNVLPPLTERVLAGAANKLFDWVDEMLRKSDGGFDARDSIIGWELIPFDKTASVLGSATATGNRGRYYNVGMVVCNNSSSSSSSNGADASQDDEMRAFKRQLSASIATAGFKADMVGHGGVGYYVNYAEEQLSAEAGFGGNAKRLRELKTRYDPENRFRKLWRLDTNV
ncbi:hypothetical protein PspLS_00247 [Pyricularia sp. CBS 133598]|nr:hypothetical protein PspLS_00247 [Pyricularia sp. CBS 133598]